MTSEELEKALCAQVGGDVFFPPDGAVNTNLYWHAKKVCAKCPIQVACLKEAMDNPSLQGVWGGTTDIERMRMRSRRAA